jgi:hypothetical protein
MYRAWRMVFKYPFQLQEDHMTIDVSVTDCVGLVPVWYEHWINRISSAKSERV